MSTDLSTASGVGSPAASEASVIAAVGDAERLAAVAASDMVDGGVELTFDRFARLASFAAAVPVALVSVVSDDRQYFAGLCGLPQPWADARQTPLSHSFCQHVVANASPLVVEDAREDPILCSNLAIVDLAVIAYAGFPIIGPTGHVLGSLCAIDHAPRRWAAAQLEALADIAVLVGNELHRRHLIERLVIEARTDVLTGLANRRAWDDELPRALRRAERLGHPLAVAVIDIDHFKGFNDRFGHPAGDEALRRICARWRTEIRDIDLLARIGGEEFGLLLPGCDAAAAVEIVERLRADTACGLTASAGVAAWRESYDAVRLFAEADRALYRAKTGGRDRSCVSRPASAPS